MKKLNNLTLFEMFIPECGIMIFLVHFRLQFISGTYVSNAKKNNNKKKNHPIVRYILSDYIQDIFTCWDVFFL